MEGFSVTYLIDGYRVPREFYLNSLQYVKDLPTPVVKAIPNVSDRRAFVEALKIMIVDGDDKRNGFDLTIAAHPDVRQKPEEGHDEWYRRVKDMIQLIPGKDYMPEYFRKQTLNEYGF